MLLAENVELFFKKAAESDHRFRSEVELRLIYRDCLRLIERCESQHMILESRQLMRILPNFGSAPNFVQDILAIDALERELKESDLNLMVRLVLRCVEDPDFDQHLSPDRIETLKQFFRAGDRSEIHPHPLLSEKCCAWLRMKT